MYWSLLVDDLSAGLLGLMKRVSEHLIEQYILHPESLDEETRRGVAEYIAQSPFAEALAGFYREFYEELNALNDYTSPSLTAFIKEHVPSDDADPQATE